MKEIDVKTFDYVKIPEKLLTPEIVTQNNRLLCDSI